MARLIPCPSCGRHVRAVERDCPFCGHAGLTTNTPGRLSVLLFGLCLTACTGTDTPTDKPQPAEPAQAEPETPTPVDPPQPEPPPQQAGETTGDEPPGAQTTGSEGTDDGAAVEEEIAEPPGKTKYGAPRPDPRPAKKYGAPPRPDDFDKPSSL